VGFIRRDLDDRDSFARKIFKEACFVF